MHNNILFYERSQAFQHVHWLTFWIRCSNVYNTLVIRWARSETPNAFNQRFSYDFGCSKKYVKRSTTLYVRSSVRHAANARRTQAVERSGIYFGISTCVHGHFRKLCGTDIDL